MALDDFQFHAADVFHEGQSWFQGLFPQQGENIGDGNPVGPSYGGISSRQGQVLEMCCSAKTVVVCYQEFPSPDAAIAAQAGAVKDDADDRGLEPVVYHAASGVSVVVLHRNDIDAGLAHLLGIPGG